MTYKQAIKKVVKHYSKVRSSDMPTGDYIFLGDFDNGQMLYKIMYHMSNYGYDTCIGYAMFNEVDESLDKIFKKHENWWEEV